MLPKKNNQNRPAAGEASYDFEGGYVSNVFEKSYHNYSSGPVDPVTPNTPANPGIDSTTKTLLLVAAGGIVLTGLLIFILGRRKH